MEACPACGAASPLDKYVDYTTQYRGDDGVIRDLVVPNVLLTQCATCDEEFLDSDAVAQVEAAQRLAIGRLTPQQLKQWRESLQISQTELSTILGFGKKTYARWETGAYTLTAAADRYIRLAMARSENYAFLESLATGLTLSAHADDLENFDFLALTEEFRSLFATNDPVVRNSQAFSSELSQGRVFSL